MSLKHRYKVSSLKQSPLCTRPTVIDWNEAATGQRLWDGLQFDKKYSVFYYPEILSINIVLLTLAPIIKCQSFWEAICITVCKIYFSFKYIVILTRFCSLNRVGTFITYSAAHHPSDLVWKCVIWLQELIVWIQCQAFYASGQMSNSG